MVGIAITTVKFIERWDTSRVESLRETYGDNFAKGRRSDMKLENLLDDVGASSLRDFLRNHNESRNFWKPNRYSISQPSPHFF